LLEFGRGESWEADAAFKLSVKVSQFTRVLDDGSSVLVPRQSDEWTVNAHSYYMKDLENDIAARVKWGSSQQIAIYEFDPNTGGEKILLDDKALSLALLERENRKKLFLYVDVQSKAVTEVMSNVSINNVSAPEQSNNEVGDVDLIDWDSLDIIPVGQDQVGAAVCVVDEEAMYEFLGLRAEDERVEKERAAAEEEAAEEIGAMDLDGAELPFDDHIPGEEAAFYDREDPPMDAGTVYPSMEEVRAAVRQRAIKGQFELGTEKSCQTLFRGYCKANGCKWAIVAQKMSGTKQVRITLNKEEHFCASTGRVRTKMATYHWVAEKANPFS